MSQPISIIICTYNPQERLLGRTLRAVARLRTIDGGRPEVVIVDNNSSPPVADLPYAQAFLREHGHARVEIEPRQGLTFARLRGIAASGGRTLIFFDDDNEPDADYVQAVQNLAERLPHVGVWGPGRIRVEFVDPVPDWVVRDTKHMFQETDWTSDQWGCAPGWYLYYPAGTGQVVSREVAEAYAALVEAGQLSAADRTGRSLSSVGDAQIVWTAVRRGLAAGRSPSLRLNHLIPASRCNTHYLARLEYGIYSSSMPAMVEVFPEKIAEAQRSLITLPSFGFHALLAAIQAMRRRRLRLLRVQLAQYAGTTVASYVAAGRDVPRWLRAAARWATREPS